MSRTRQSRTTRNFRPRLVRRAYLLRKELSNRCLKPRCNMESAEPEVGGSVEKTGGVPISAEWTGIRDVRDRTRQPPAQLAVAVGRNPHGVESVPKAGEGTSGELGNFAVFSRAGWREMIEATDYRRGRGRSLHSSRRAGKPSTSRRETVGEASRQEAGR